MKQLLILSGKGGTGKTTISSAFIKLSQAGAYADCDVDAPNLHLVMKQSVKAEISNYYGLKRAKIDPFLCSLCDICREHCKFGAISIEDSYVVDPYSCEGCGVCQLVCPSNAIELEEYIDGHLMLYNGVSRTFSTAQLKMGSGTSGMLVSEVKKQLIENTHDADLVIIDGSPGIGCPVIASISGVDMVLVVAEPSLSGITDMKRIVETAERFETEIMVCVNKHDMHIKNTEIIKDYCRDKNIDYVGDIPFDLNAVKAINMGKTIVDIDCISGEAVRAIYDVVMGKITKDKVNLEVIE